MLGPTRAYPILALSHADPAVDGAPKPAAAPDPAPSPNAAPVVEGAIELPFLAGLSPHMGGALIKSARSGPLSSAEESPPIGLGVGGVPWPGVVFTEEERWGGGGRISRPDSASRTNSL